MLILFLYQNLRGAEIRDFATALRRVNHKDIVECEKKDASEVMLSLSEKEG